MSAFVAKVLTKMLSWLGGILAKFAKRFLKYKQIDEKVDAETKAVEDIVKAIYDVERQIKELLERDPKASVEHLYKRIKELEEELKNAGRRSNSLN